MMRPPAPLTPPDTSDDLLLCLRAVRLLSASRARALARRWAARPQPGGCEGRVRELLAAGVLTRYQAGQILAGRARRLRLGPYRVLDRLGVGGMGHVYKAEHILMRRIVALKIVARLPRLEDGALPAGPDRAPSRRELLTRFRREVRSAGLMSHANIVTAYDAGVARGFLYLVMEYIEGIDLGRFVTENGPLPVPLACEAVRQAALALQYAHDRGLVHRDIKPDNLLLTWPGPGSASGVGSLPSLPDGTSGEGAALIKLLDLGLALPTQLPAERVEPAGTPDFMAPEQAHGRAVDGRSDLYSLGCTFYYLLTGHVPYPGGTCAEKLLRHGLDVPGAVRDLRPDVPLAVAAIVERLMAKEPEDRYPGPAAVAAVLRGLADQGWSLGSPPPERRTETTADGNSDNAHRGSGHRGLLLLGNDDAGRSDDGLDGRVNETPSVPSLPLLPPLPVPVALPSPRRRLPGPVALMTAVLAGPLLALMARGLPSSVPAAAEYEQVAPPSLMPFRVEHDGREFVSLAEAIAAASDGDTISIRGPGPHRLPPTNLGNKSLMLRAAAGDRPRLEAKDPAADAPWQALLVASRPLTLKGLDLVSAADAPIVAATGATLRLSDCRLAATGGGPAVVARGCELCLNSCRVRAVAAAVAIEVDDNSRRIDLTGNTVHVGDPAGVALAIWAPEETRLANVSLRLERNIVEAGRVASFRTLPGRLSVEATANDFTFREALASFSGYTGDAAWRRSTIWRGRDNRCHSSGYWLSVDGRSVAVNDAAGWQRLWAEPSADGRSQELPVPPAGLR
jgi:serine/threonine protein kinase